MRAELLSSRTSKAAAAALGLLFLISATAGDAAENSRPYQLQLGVGFAAPYNAEEPFIDLAKLRRSNWAYFFGGGKQVKGGEAVKQGYADPTTRMPTAKAGAANYVELAAFLPSAELYRDYYADDYVLSWNGDAYGYLQRWEGGVRSSRSKNSVVYSLTPQQAKSPVIRFSKVGDGFTDLHFYRKKHEERFKRGEIWNPEFINYVRRYDIARTMDLQSSNNFLVRRFDQIATMDEPWGNRSAVAWPEQDSVSIPYEVLFSLGVTADVAVWMTLPPQLGSPISAADPSLRNPKKPSSLDSAKLREAIAPRTAEVLASPEWEVFAREFVDRYLASGYPVSRPLYLEVGNEIWNNAGGFWISTNYAVAIGQGYSNRGNAGRGYGVLVGRYMMALEKEFARRKISPNVVYVVASHTANTYRSEQAYVGLREFLERNNLDVNAHMAKTALAVTNYYGHFNDMSKYLFESADRKQYAALWLQEIDKDPEGFKRRITELVEHGPSSIKATGPNILLRFSEHKAIAEKAGSRFLGGYEGGSHFNVPRELAQSKKFNDWWTPYHWGAEGADIARTINKDLIKAFPGVVIANYKSIGELDPESPWNDGHYSAPTPMMEMWDEFARPDRVN